jgi:endonuclease-3
VKRSSLHLKKNYPDAKCALDFHNAFECLVAISLSAQTTDESVNAVTPAFFVISPRPAKMAEAPISAIEERYQILGSISQ